MRPIHPRRGRSRTPSWVRLIVGIAALAVAVAGCGAAPTASPSATVDVPIPTPAAAPPDATSSTASPSGGAAETSGPDLGAPGRSASPDGGLPSSTPGSDAWTRAPDIEQPAGFMKVHTDASGEPYMGGCAPCHPAIDTIMTDVTDGPAGLVAVGWVLQGFRGATWHSLDGMAWTLTGDFPEQTLLSAVASNDARYVAVGRAGQGATAWSSTDGVAWRRTPSTAAFDGGPQRVTSVVAWKGGFVAGGFRGTDFFSADGAFWTSPDGVAWTRAPASPSLADARVVALAVGGRGLVAVGQTGPADRPGPAVAWTSTDGVHWERSPDSPAFRGARVRSVASVPGIGLVAAGETIAGDTGIVWTSPDGITWDRVPAPPEFGRPGIQVRMYDVTAGPSGATVVGTETQGIQYGAAAIWTSPDGTTWSRAPTSVALQDTEMNAVAPWRARLVAVGDRGAPDAYQATAWVGPTAAGP